jgi:hypothetical protein
MAIDINKIAVGSAVVSIGDWVTNAGAGSLTDVGATKGGVTLTPSYEHFKLTTDQTFGPHRSKAHSGEWQCKIPMLEADLPKLRRVLRQVSGNLTGTTPNHTLAVDGASEQYLQVQIVTVGIAGSGGTYGTRTITLWRCAIESIDEIAFRKDGEQMVTITLLVCEDASIAAAGNGRYFKIVDSGAA